MSLVSELLTKVTVDSSQFSKEMSKVTNDTAGFAKGFNVAQVAVVAGIAIIAAAIASISTVIIDRAHDIDDMAHAAEKLGVSVSSFQSLAYAADQSDVSISTLNSSFSRMSSTINNAFNGNKGAVQALDAIGLSAQELINLAPDKQFERIAQSIQQITNSTQQRDAIKDIFGKGGIENIALITSNLQEARQEYESFNIALTDGQVAQASAFDDTSKSVKSLFSGMVDLIAADVIPAFTVFLDVIKETLLSYGSMRDVAKNVAESIVSGIRIMAQAFTGFLKVVDFIIDAFTILKELVLTVANVFNNDIKPSNKIEFSNKAEFGQKIVDGIDKYQRSVEDTAKSSDVINSALNSSSNVVTRFTSSIGENVRVVDASTTSIANLNKAAQATASTLDKFTQIQNALDAPGKKQASEIINKAVKDQGNELADSSEFTKIFAQAISEAQSGDMSNIQSKIKQLQAVIDEQKMGRQEIDYSGGFATSSEFQPGRDISGLVGALNELKAFLSSKANGKQEVEVKIEVAPSKDFVTTITQNNTFKQAVDNEIAAQTAASSRADLP